MEGFAAFNPHAALRLADTQFEATKREWRKWLPGDAMPAHWYTVETLRDLMAAYVADERHGGRRRTVREFVSEFRGLSATAKQKTVTAGLAGMYLADFIQSGDLDVARVERLLAAMQAHSNPPKPAALGILGEAHMKAWMERYANVSSESIRYVKRMGENGLPHVVEVAFGLRKADDAGRRILTGLNWSPALGSPAPELEKVIQEMRLDPYDPVTILVHLAQPRFEFLDRGKTRLAL